MSKQDRQGARTPADLERRYDFRKKFSEVMDAARTAEWQAIKVQNELKIVEGRVTEIKSDMDGITIRVSATEVVTAENQNATKKLQGELGKVEADVQTRATVQQLTEVKAAADGLRVSVSKVETTLGDKADKVAVEEITEHFRFAEDGLTITNTGNGMGIGVSEKRVVFTGGQNPTTIITPNAMETTNLAVGQRLDVGGFSWIPRTNGNLSFRYTGGG